MGSGKFDNHSWASYTSSKSASMGVLYASASPEQIFDQRQLAQDLDPSKIVLRESRDSADNPVSTPLIVGLDVTGSMGVVLAEMAKNGLTKLMTETYDRKPISDPHVMAMGIGDAECDNAPLQVTQFEADIRIAEQLERIWLERGGGGNNYESYTLPWYFAAHYTAIDSFEKRGQKGFLFTVGDEEPPQMLRQKDVARVFDRQVGGPFTTEDLLAQVSEKWHVYHLMVAEGSHARAYPDAVRTKWTDLLGQRAIWLKDHRKMAQVIVSLLQMASGASASAVVDSWDDETADVLRSIDLGATA